MGVISAGCVLTRRRVGPGDGHRPLSGDRTSELAQFGQLRKVFKASDIAVADRSHRAWFSLGQLREQDIDFVMRKQMTFLLVADTQQVLEHREPIRYAFRAGRAHSA